MVRFVRPFFFGFLLLSSLPAFASSAGVTPSPDPWWIQESPATTPGANTLSFMTENGACTIDSQGLLACPLFREEDRTPSFYGGVLNPGTPLNMGSVGLQFSWGR